MTMTGLRIDFVSDVVCPWCAIGLKALEQALARIGDEIDAEIHFQPFELNPHMPPEGQDIAEHLAQKYGSTPAQLAKNQEALRARGEQLGFIFDMQKRTRIYNTFDAHRLLHWAETLGKQRGLKHALLHAYFTEGRDPSNHEVLTAVAASVGLDPAQAASVLSSDAFAEEVRTAEQFFQRQGIQAVPSVIIDRQYLIQGGQPVEVFEQALRQIATEKQKNT
jgi:predicted DsbA family dithiol-disulfide isomerase